SGKYRFDFLGFEFYWGKDRSGKPLLKRRTSRKKLRSSIKSFTEWCKESRNLEPRVLFRRLNAKLRGYYNYYGVFGNYDGLQQFFNQVKRILFKWLNRRSQRRSYNWRGFEQLLEHYRIEQPRIVGPPKMRQLQLI
ncbi:MAG: group II intron reverse transcriptase/maturase, partial [Proteobacteria bacterium]|nr:group II intron reverse transcriptase/maturase [Pseudomonadota bacterium]